ncbi:MAG: C45 family autoproteolytic acyltransferase/hydrolase [Nannocystaceae bacterium]
MARFAPGPAPSERRTLLALLRALTALALALAIVLVILYQSYLKFTDLSPPEVTPPSAALEVDRSGRRITHGESWLARQGGLWVLHLVGAPAALGDSHGQLVARLFHRLDAQVSAALARRYPTSMDAWSANLGIRWDFRRADLALPEAIRTELAALAEALPEAESEHLGGYHRLFLYQCFLELGGRLEDVLLEATAFAAAPRSKMAASASGNLIIGRSFAVDLGPGVALDRLVTFVYRDGKYPFVSIGWPTLLGVVTGINARGIFVALNPTRTDDPPEDGAPLPILLRQVLEDADTLDQALEILKNAPLRSSGAVLVGDGVQRKAVVVELSPRTKEERRQIRGESTSLVWATDHLVHEPFDRDAQNDRIRRYTASGYRYQRLEERLGELSPLDPARAVELLRDRKGTQGVELGLGNHNALEDLALTHAVVVDATAMVLWVAEGPSALGRFRAFDLRYLLMRQGSRPAPLDDFPADRLLHSEEYADFEEAGDAIAHAQSLLAAGRPERALASAKLALALAPDIGDLHRLLGDIERDLGHRPEARAHYERYLELVPGRLRDQERVRGILEELGDS